MYSIVRYLSKLPTVPCKNVYRVLLQAELNIIKVNNLKKYKI